MAGLHTQSNLTKPYKFTIPTELLQPVMQAYEESMEDTGLVSERPIMQAIIDVAYEVNGLDINDKPLINIGESPIERYRNCTDTAASQLAVCQAVSIPALGKFDGRHASVIIPTDGGYWDMDGLELDHSSLSDEHSQDKHTLDELVAHTVQAQELIRTLGGAYVYSDDNDGSWRIKHFRDNNVRFHSPLKSANENIKLDEKIVLLAASTAMRSLSAIDILATITSSLKKKPDSVTPEALQDLKGSLVQYVPKLK